MTYQRLAYDDADSADTMRRDCSAALRPRMLAPAPSIRYRRRAEAAKPRIDVSEAAARLAAALHLHLN